MNAITSKEFNSKKAAQAAARKVYGAEYGTLVTIDEFEEKWYISGIAAEVKEEVEEPDDYCLMCHKGPQKLNDAGVCANCADQAAPASEPQQAESTATDEPESAAPAGLLAGLCGIIAGTVTVLEPAAPAPKSEPKTTGLIIEKNRPEQNGVKRPSAGGLCRAVWDACWAHQEATGLPPTAKEVKALAEVNGWNPNNASIEYYQWRKFNGISGRIAAPKAEVETKVEGE